MAWLGLITELLLLALGIYLYLFAIGSIHFKKPESAERAEKFRKENASWLRIASIGLTAIMFINVCFSLGSLF